MKELLYRLIAGLVICAALAGCSALPASAKARSWAWEDGRGTIRLGTLLVDKGASSASVEREIRSILPLIMGERGYRVPGEGESAAYITDLRVSEREYLEGWDTRRSISAELLIRRSADDPAETPLAAGRASAAGTASLSSSAVLEDLIRLAAKRALSALDQAEENRTLAEQARLGVGTLQAEL